jgi:hypothetical protein
MTYIVRRWPGEKKAVIPQQSFVGPSKKNKNIDGAIIIPEISAIQINGLFFHYFLEKIT